ncbi:MAG: periplasmic heavy metal sensor [Desulfovibrio sp.]|nr:MAG: periplasmic heavy metal sensor [Desulfovibrio sp.]
MKKTLLMMTLVAVFGLFASQALAFGPCGGVNCTNLTEEQAVQYQAYLDETAEMRRQLTLDRTELTAVLNNASPDSNKARALMERIYDTQEALRAKAAEHGFSSGGCGNGGGNGNGGGYGNSGCPGGGNCNGTGPGGASGRGGGNRAQRFNS